MRARERQLAKMSSPEYQHKQAEKRKEQVKRQKEKAIARAKTRGAEPKPRQKPMKSKGMAGKARNASEKSLHDHMASLGCICCINKGLIAPFAGGPVSIHHIKGRTVPEAHLYALPLCQWHHDTPLPQGHAMREKFPFVFPIHAKGAEGGKTAWEQENGSQLTLLEQVKGLLPMAK